MNFIFNLIFFYERKIQPGLTISKDALVVDIGSGDKPFWRADVFVDMLSLGNLQRITHSSTIHNLGTFVDADVMHLPFKDKSFDFSFSSHLLEHVTDPAQAIKEIARISKAGYLEVPNGILETIQPFHSHLWFIYNNNDTLVFFRKSKKMHSILTQNNKIYNNFAGNIKDPFIRIYWKKKIRYKIIDEYKDSEKFYAKNEKNNKIKNSSINFYLLLIRIIRLLIYKKKFIPDKIFNKQ